jgi:hypothetical protein
MSWRDKNFRYIPSKEQGDGYLKKRFAKVQRELKAKAAQEAANAAEAQTKTIPLKARKA